MAEGVGVMAVIDRRCFVLHDNRVGAGTLSGGDWVLPISNLALPTLKEDVARCVTGQVADATFTLTLPKVVTVGGLALVGHTLPGGAQVRLTWRRGGQTVGVPAWEPVFPRVRRTRDMSFDDPEWFAGRPSPALRAFYTATFLVVPPQRLRADEVVMELDPRGQPFDLGYLFLAPLFRPDWPMAWGRSLEAASRSVVELTPGGRPVGARRRPLRRQRVEFADLTKDEAMRWLDIAHTHDTLTPLLFVPDPGDPRNWWREVFLARLSKLLSVTEKDDGYYAVTVELEEVIA